MALFCRAGTRRQRSKQGGQDQARDIRHAARLIFVIFVFPAGGAFFGSLCHGRQQRLKKILWYGGSPTLRAT